jgi:hypothetical protein
VIRFKDTRSASPTSRIRLFVHTRARLSVFGSMGEKRGVEVCREGMDNGSRVNRSCSRRWRVETLQLCKHHRTVSTGGLTPHLAIGNDCNVLEGKGARLGHDVLGQLTGRCEHLYIRLVRAIFNFQHQALRMSGELNSR